MAKMQELKLTVNYVGPPTPINGIMNFFYCTIEGHGLKELYGFSCSISTVGKTPEPFIFISPSDEARVLFSHYPTPTPGEWESQKINLAKTPISIIDIMNKCEYEFRYQVIDEFRPIFSAIDGYTLKQSEYDGLVKLIKNNDKPSVNKVFGDILKTILEEVGYSVTVQSLDYFFPSPTSTGLISPVFAMGIQKEVKPTGVKEGYETEFIYLSIEKPQSKTQLQLKLINTPEERLYELQQAFKDYLTPYGLKSLYLVIEECGHNKRNPWFILDSNRCLDLLGHKRNEKGVHYSRSKKRLLKELEALTKINFNIERRQPKGGVKNKDKAFRFKAPLLSITGQFEEWEVDAGKPIEEGTLITDGIQIFLHPQIYVDIGDWYTYIPHYFLKIDARSKPHAILLYPYIANQWRIGWFQYQGTIKQSIRRILEGAGLLDRLPKRANQQRDFIENIKDSLIWLKDQKEFWIKSVRIDSKNIPLLEQTVTITMADEHPLKSSLKNLLTK